MCGGGTLGYELNMLVSTGSGKAYREQGNSGSTSFFAMLRIVGKEV